MVFLDTPLLFFLTNNSKVYVIVKFLLLLTTSKQTINNVHVITVYTITKVFTSLDFHSCFKNQNTIHPQH